MGRIESDGGDGTYVVRLEEEDVELAGLEGTGDAEVCNGVYRRLVGRFVNDRPVWQQQGGGGEERFLYYASSGKWFVGGRKSMEAGKAAGWVHSQATTAEAPFGDDLSWQYGDGSKWADGPSIRWRSLDQTSGTCGATARGPVTAAAATAYCYCCMCYCCCSTGAAALRGTRLDSPSLSFPASFCLGRGYVVYPLCLCVLLRGCAQRWCRRSGCG